MKWVLIIIFVIIVIAIIYFIFKNPKPDAVVYDDSIAVGIKTRDAFKSIGWI